MLFATEDPVQQCGLSAPQKPRQDSDGTPFRFGIRRFEVSDLVGVVTVDNLFLSLLFLHFAHAPLFEQHNYSNELFELK